MQEAGGTNWQLDRRHHWGRWIDDLAVEQVDTDHDGALDTTLWPVTDLLGSVQLLTDAASHIVERVEYETDGTPRFFGEDATPPSAVRVAWTGDGVRPTGDSVEASVFEIGFDEWLGEGSVGNAVATLTPDGGEAVSLGVVLDADGRGVTLPGATVETGTSYALHLEGLTGRSGNDMWVLDLSYTVGDPDTYETLMDAAPPLVLAVLDAADGLYVLFDEPVVPLDGVDVAETITVERGAGVVAGSAERVNAQLFKWTADEGAPWYPQQGYEITQIHLEDLALAPNAVATLPAAFTHVATFDDQALVAYSKPNHSTPLGQSQYGVTSLFQGRTWHEELGLYYYRARWYGPTGASFFERDPSPRNNTNSLYVPFELDLSNTIDPSGRIPESSTQDTQAQTYMDFTGEDIRQTHLFLREQGITHPERSFNFYWHGKYLRFRFGTFGSTGFDENLVRVNFRAVDNFSGKYNQPWQIDQRGESLRELVFGQPGITRGVEYNRQFQRFRLFQAERIIDRFYDEWPETMRLSPFKGARRHSDNNVVFDKAYVRAHRSATFEILAKWRRFQVPNIGLAQNILQAAFSSIYVLSEENMREGTLQYLEYWTRKQFGWESEVDYKFGGEPIKVRLP